MGQDELAHEILAASTPEQAKEISSRVPSHLHGSWHRVKMDIMKEILEAKLDSCPEFRMALINSVGKRLVEAVKSDIFWSSGLSPREAETTKPDFYPGQNHMGYLLEQIRTDLLLEHSSKSSDELDLEQEVGMNSDIFTFSSPTDVHASSAHPTDPLSIISSDAQQCSTISDPSPSTTDPYVSGVTTTGSSEGPDLNSTTAPPSDDEAVAMENTNSESHARKPLPSKEKTTTSIPQIQPRTNRIRPSGRLVPSNQEQFMASWMKRKLSPEKEADTTTTSKQTRGENGDR